MNTQLRATGGGVFSRWLGGEEREPIIEPYLDKKAIAAYFGFSVRQVEHWIAAGAPDVLIHSRPRMRASEVERWLYSTGYITRP